MIKNIVFDMGNVLLAYTPQEYIKAVTTDKFAAGAVLRELFYGREWGELDAGTITEEQAVERVTLRIPQYAEYVRKAMDNWHSDMTPIAGMPEIVERLKKRGYGIYLLSNTSLRFFNYKDRIDMFRHFDGFIISAWEKLLKPDRAIFDRICGRFGLRPGECIFTDDLQANIDGALRAGFQAHLFTGPEELYTYLKKMDIL